jgi:hypothetical protein
MVILNVRDQNQPVIMEFVRILVMELVEPMQIVIYVV